MSWLRLNSVFIVVWVHTDSFIHEQYLFDPLYARFTGLQAQNDSYWNLSAFRPVCLDSVKVVTQADRKHLGNGIRKYRKLEGLTQERLAEKVDLNPVYMGQIERGYKVPTVDVLLRIAKALKVRLRDIVYEL